MRPWVAFFSQTGSEINNLSKSLGIYPDVIATNKQDMTGINEELIKLTTFREHKLNRTIWCVLPEKPTKSPALTLSPTFKEKSLKCPYNTPQYSFSIFT